MKDLSGIRPKLKQDVVFLQTDEGVFFKSDEATFQLKGKSVYRWISALSSYLTGDYTLEQLCEGLESTQRDTAVQLVNVLLQRGVLKNEVPEDPGLLSDQIRKRFRPQIEFIDLYTDHPQERFKTFRESRLLLAGSGESFTALARALLRNGLKEIFLASTDEPSKYLKTLEPEVVALHQDGVEALISSVDLVHQRLPENKHKYHIIVYCADDSSLKDVFDLQQHCIREGLMFIPAVVFVDQAMMGPLVRPPEGPCWLCALMRVSANVDSKRSAALWQALFLGDGLLSKNSALNTPLARILGSGLAFELFKILARPLPPETESGVIFQHLETLESHHAKLVPHPLCPVCSRFDLDRSIQQTLEIVVGKRDKKQTSPKEEFLRQEALLFDPYTGILNTFADDTIMQVPLKMCKLIVGSPISPTSGSFEVTAYSVENVLDARQAAFKEAMKRYTKELPDIRGMVLASFNQMVAEGKVVFAAQELSTWSGIPSFDRHTRYEWLPAFSLFTQRLCYVQAAAIYPHSTLNRLGIFERTSAGSATGLTFQDTLAAGIISALGYEQVRDAVRGCNSVIFINAESQEVTDLDLHFLMNSAKRFERPFMMLEVLHESPLHVVLACTTDSITEQISTVGISLSGVEAQCKALLHFVGDLQLLKYEGHCSDSHQPLFFEFSPRTCFVYADPNQSQLKEPAATIEHLHNYLKEQGRDVLFVSNTPVDLWEKETFIYGTVLLTKSRKE